MSATYELVCHETRESLWVGQGSYASGKMETFYSTPEHCARLGQFLARTMGKELVLMESQKVDTDYKQID